MENTSTVTLLAGGSLILGLIAAGLFFYFMLSQRRKRSKKESAPVEQPAANATLEPAPKAPPAAKDEPKTSFKQHSLFVVFDNPSPDTTQQLTDWLRQVEAKYDPLTKVYHVPGKQPSNPVTIANAFLPGEMPDLFRDSNHEVKGISLLVKPPLHKRRNQQMIVFVDLAKQAAEIFQGQLLDADRNPATDNTYQRIIG
ncbi:cell division protein ZipA C-terminal FtsZ-binding domain-containing protein [Vreelandella neptunia]|uniref:Cell division protein ZipA n=1 Tax=Vreelandella neptunia TaxID=115551 RepID=A0ABS9S9F0_9GAMM|nr:cell division protein ZipA C-terminal FtsZ-binding domain-containing protein [Halomonas neptunia]MCH4812736.1 cell division protein ZipA C-terminal FtsZ-binding domain-containing protein [Halomonas neptunia]